MFGPEALHRSQYRDRMSTGADATDIRTLLVGPDSALRLRPVSMEAIGWQERRDLQPLVRANPELVEPGLLLVAEEFTDWEALGGRVADRLDLLFLDEAGSLLVVELKRGEAPDRTQSQALVYAAFCDQLTVDDIVQQYAVTHAVEHDEARAAVVGHAPGLETLPPGRVRVRILAEEFPPQVTSTVLFLRELGVGGRVGSQLDIGCTKLTAYELPDGSHLLAAQPVIPLPETEAYQVRRRRRAVADDDVQERSKRVPNAVVVLQREKSIAPETPLRLNRQWFSSRDRPQIDAFLDAHPEWGTVLWNAEVVVTRAVQVNWSDEPQSLDAHFQAVLEAAGIRGKPGATTAWVVGDTGRTVRELADDFLAAADDASGD